MIIGPTQDTKALPGSATTANTTEDLLFPRTQSECHILCFLQRADKEVEIRGEDKWCKEEEGEIDEEWDRSGRDEDSFKAGDDEGFEDKESKEDRWMREIYREALRFVSHYWTTYCKTASTRAPLSADWPF